MIFKQFMHVIAVACGPVRAVLRYDSYSCMSCMAVETVIERCCEGSGVRKNMIDQLVDCQNRLIRL